MISQDVRFTICAVRAEETYPLRAAILMAGDEEGSALHGDLAPTTMHFAVRDHDAIVAVASVCKEGHAGVSDADAWRLRGMAVHPSVRGLGFGRLLVNLSIRHVREQCGILLWCTARESAYRFYEILGFDRDPIPISMRGRDDMKFYLMQRRIER
ncbi:MULTISPECIES: GNAT family N-acetyltransferase [Burkholderia]|uniref:GNAT family N-acetyltransferase n=1 Tax=Burkholderia anthinoferrum TaxID=3090833 RepID=A0ABU5WH19_9BURK|nr:MULTISPECIES: GNAT family N-acetyltransferase [Burkholderia]MEB2503992.1 GNAT family N-acetyltransferase [Burkholderia anthinoferrum]MEB2530764.1 GNAT family N-acetyltransferase [Burkholderia anthinoferrum]MEB2560018.1 GNAT family N-acetyltransferase [Burkholderia anthinoferrum]MEB2578257.1 GNAT family N-acetyltransferase [Burkholderia anthinoferrum]KVN57704.1 GCN5 family acetyltransferase [Burkholderia anthina]